MKEESAMYDLTFAEKLWQKMPERYAGLGMSLQYILDTAKGISCIGGAIGTPEGDQEVHEFVQAVLDAWAALSGEKKPEDKPGCKSFPPSRLPAEWANMWERNWGQEEDDPDECPVTEESEE
jgi:hypothetical protein